MTSHALTVLQAVAAAISALTAAYLVRMTVARDREMREERFRDLAHEQLRRLVEGLASVQQAMRDRQALEEDFDIARAEVAAAVALRPVVLPACDALLGDDMPKPPYGMGDSRPWAMHQAAFREVTQYARSIARNPETLSRR
jgi:hypothetical protein